MIRVLAIRDLRVIAAGQLLSGIGDWLLLMAAPYFVLKLTGSTLATGLSLAAGTVPALLLGPIAGALADRWDRRRTMIATDLARMGAVCFMLLVHHPGQVGLIYTALVVESCFSQLFGPAAGALIPAVVGRGPQLAAANSLGAFVSGLVRLVGGPLGGALYALFGFATVVCLDAGSYAASAVLVALLRYRADPGADAVPACTARPVHRLLEEIRAGLGHVRRSPALHALFGTAALFSFGNAILNALVVPYVALVLHAATQTLGLLFGALGIGFVIGAPISHAVNSRYSERAVLAWGLVLGGVCFAVTFNVHDAGWDGLLFVLIGPPTVCYSVAAGTFLPRWTPDRLMGRVGASYGVVQAGTVLVGMIAGSLLGQRLGIVACMNVGAALVAASALLALRLPPQPSEPIAQSPGLGSPESTVAIS
jgi:MFS family permease